MLQQRALPRRPDARHLVERRGGDALLAPRAVGADGKAVRLVPERLDAVKHRVARFQEQRLLSLKIDALAAGIAVGPLGDRGDPDFRQAKLVQDLLGRRQLPRAAVDQHQVRRRPAIALGPCPAP